jgi:hypothetical protein
MMNGNDRIVPVGYSTDATLLRCCLFGLFFVWSCW